MTGRLDGQATIVFGGNGHVGRAVVERFQREGAAVLVADVSEPPAESPTLFAHCDVTREEQIAAAVAQAKDAFGSLHAAVHCAYWQEVAGVDELSLDGWARTLDVALRSVWLCARESVRAMSDGGALVHISSVQAVMPYRRRVAYVAAKGGVDSLTRELALELAPRGIRVNAIRPGAIGDELDTSARGKLYPLGRLVSAHDVASAALFLAGRDAAGITGEIVNVDGGLSIQSAELHDSDLGL